MLLLDGKKVRDAAAAKLTAEIAACSSKPRLAIIQVGTMEESNRYIEQKKRFADLIGAEALHCCFEETISEEKLLAELAKLNKDEKIHGIIVQLPLPKHVKKELLIDAINPVKDVDGLTATSVKALWDSKPTFIPATAKAVLTLLAAYGIPLLGKRVAVIGRSALVGKPTAILLTNHDATVTLCHSKTKNLLEITKESDILIVAAGKPSFIGQEYVKAGQVIVDVGINLVTGQKLEEEIPRKKLVGDVDFEAVKDIVAAISPVPGGVGPLTVLSLFENLVMAFRLQKSES